MIDYYVDLDVRQIILKELQTKGKITDFEITFKNRDGSHVPCSVSAKLVLNINGHPEKIIEVCTTLLIVKI